MGKRYGIIIHCKNYSLTNGLIPNLFLIMYAIGMASPDSYKQNKSVLIKKKIKFISLFSSAQICAHQRNSQIQISKLLYNAFYSIFLCFTKVTSYLILNLFKVWLSYYLEFWLKVTEPTSMGLKKKETEREWVEREVWEDIYYEAIIYDKETLYC